MVSKIEIEIVFLIPMAICLLVALYYLSLTIFGRLMSWCLGRKITKIKRGICNQIKIETESIDEERLKFKIDDFIKFVGSLNEVEPTTKRVIQMGDVGVKIFCKNIGAQEFVNFLNGIILLTSKEGEDYLRSLNIDLSGCEIKTQQL